MGFEPSKYSFPENLRRNRRGPAVLCVGNFPERDVRRMLCCDQLGVMRKDVDIAGAMDQKNRSRGAAYGVRRVVLVEINPVAQLRIAHSNLHGKAQQPASYPGWSSQVERGTFITNHAEG